MSHSVTSESDDGGLSTDSHPSNDCNNFKGRLNGEVVLKKGPWTSTEDAVLVEYVKKHGEGNWNAVQKHSGLSRCGKSCRLRWTNHLRPNLKKGSFTLEEERLIIELHAKMGNKWSRMAAHCALRNQKQSIKDGSWIEKQKTFLISPSVLVPMQYSVRPAVLLVAHGTKCPVSVKCLIVPENN